jgi:hypothetical protein
VALAGDETLVALVRRGLRAMPPIALSPGEEKVLVAYLRYLEGFPSG